MLRCAALSQQASSETVLGQCLAKADQGDIRLKSPAIQPAWPTRQEVHIHEQELACQAHQAHQAQIRSGPKHYRKQNRNPRSRDPLSAPDPVSQSLLVSNSAHLWTKSLRPKSADHHRTLPWPKVPQSKRLAGHEVGQARPCSLRGRSP